MPRFVVLTHDHPVLHWDFMLEEGASLRTWRLASEPDALGEISAESLPGHRLQYLDYEGPISDNRGEVRQWDSGEFTWIQSSPVRVEVLLAGKKLRGTAVLEKGEATGAWSLSYRRD